MAIGEVLVGAGAAMLGSFVTIAGQWTMGRRHHQDQVAESLRQARASAHVELMQESHLTAHTLFRTTKGHPAPLPYSGEVASRIDSVVLHRVFKVEMIAGDESTEAALSLLDELFNVRKLVQRAQWHDVDYMATLSAYQAARVRYIVAVRKEVLNLHGASDESLEWLTWPK